MATYEEVDVTPAMAQKLLKKNVANYRKYKPDGSAIRYAKDMSEHKWDFTVDPIEIDTNDELQNGQNRLHAVIMSGETIKFVIARGVTPSANTDTGTPRTVTDHLIQLGIKNAGDVKSTAKACVMHDKGLWADRSWKMNTFTPNEVIDYALKHEEGIQDTLILARKCKPILPMAVSGAIMFIGSGRKKPTENETCVWFSTRIQTGVELEKGAPPLALRDRLMNTNIRYSAYFKRVVSTMAWNKTVEGVSVKHLKFSETGPHKTKVPKEILVAHNGP